MKLFIIVYDLAQSVTALCFMIIFAWHCDISPPPPSPFLPSPPRVHKDDVATQVLLDNDGKRPYLPLTLMLRYMMMALFFVVLLICDHYYYPLFFLFRLRVTSRIGFSVLLFLFSRKILLLRITALVISMPLCEVLYISITQPHLYYSRVLYSCALMAWLRNSPLQ